LDLAGTIPLWCFAASKDEDLWVVKKLIDRVRKRLLRASNPLAARIYDLTGLYPKSMHLYELAFTHSSARVGLEEGLHKSNERLEYLGDAVLDLVVADVLFRRFPFRDEGFLTNMRSKVVNTQFLDSLSRALGLDKMLQHTAGNRRNETSKNMNADVFEAFLGAIYLDQGFPKTYRFILDRILTPFVDLEELTITDHNYKSRLVEWAQRNGKKISFEVEARPERGRPGKITVRILLDGQVVAKATDSSRKLAEQNASAYYLEHKLGQDTVQ
jgi:ribonuclease-3